MRETTYRVPRRGLATSFTQSEIPVEFAAQFLNRTLDSVGAAEKRPGIQQTGDVLPGARPITGLHEYVNKDGVATLYATSEGRIFRFEDPSWAEVYSGANPDARLQSVQFGDFLIFVNGVDPNFYTDDNGETWNELLALIEEGKLGSGSNTTTVTDNDISDWIGTNVNVNDLVYNARRNAYAIITAVTSAALTITTMATGATGLGKIEPGSVNNPAQGDAYQIIDLVQNNLFRVDNSPVTDNAATGGTGTNPTTVAVSGVNFATTDVRVGDIVYNTTRNAVTRVESIATAIAVTSVAAQTAGDSFTMFKSAMPLTAFAAVHFNRLYLVDARDRRKIRVSGANDPQDFTVDGGTLDPITLNFDFDSQGDYVVAIGSYQRFLMLCGRRNIYAFQGEDPLNEDGLFQAVGTFPQGTASRYGTVSIGNDFLFVSDDGVQSVRQIVDSATLNRANVSDPISVTLREQIRTAEETQIQLIHYPRRSWVLLQVGSQLYCYTYTSDIYDRNETILGGSWSLFDGPFARQLSYLARQDGDLICGNASGRLFDFDVGVFSDDGEPIQTRLQTGWLSTESPRASTTRVKQGMYLRQLVEAPDTVEYVVQAAGDWELQGTDTATFSAAGGGFLVGSTIIGPTAIIGGSGITDVKVPLRWRGKVVRLTWETNTTLGPDKIGRYSVYTAMFGVR